ncbi:MAG: N-acetyltransferase [Cyanobacteria bacterium J06643_13]
MVDIRETVEGDLEDILLVERSAFGGNEEADLVENLLGDRSAKPILSLLAVREDRPVGHILFTSAGIENQTNHISAAILAPLAVVPDAQKQGIGGKLIKQGLELLSESGIDLVFVLGYPEYYSRHGFQPAGAFGLEASYPIPQKHFDAWMVLFLNPEVRGSVSGKVVCADALDKPEYWLE